MQITACAQMQPPRQHNTHILFFFHLHPVAAYEPDSEPAVVAASLTQLLTEAEPPSTSHDKEVRHLVI